jgi:calcineurin-like phosphoesterase family protein
MTTFFTSDHYFGHQNIIAYTNRPYASVDEMNLDLIARHNSVVKPDDVVFVLGDVCMGKLDDSLALVSLLNGTKYLIPGNHDRMFDATGDKYRNAAARYTDAGFADILSLVITDTYSFGKTTLTHLPPSGDSREDDRFTSLRPQMPAHGLLLHGHTHGLYRKSGRCIDVGVDANNGYPLSEADVADLAALGDVDASPIA